MDPDMMYDEFGNYVGPELESDDEDDDDSPDEQEVSFLFCFHEFFSNCNINLSISRNF